MSEPNSATVIAVRTYASFALLAQHVEEREGSLYIGYDRTEQAWHATFVWTEGDERYEHDVQADSKHEAMAKLYEKIQ